MGLILSIFLMAFQLAWKVLKFTGAWISYALVMLIDELILSNLMGITMTSTNYPEIYPIYEKFMIVVMVVPIILVTGYHIYRLFKPKPVPPEEQYVTISRSEYDRLTETPPEVREEKLAKIQDMANQLVQLRREQEAQKHKK